MWERIPTDPNSPKQYKKSPNTGDKLRPTPRREVKGYKCDQELLELAWRTALEVAVVDDDVWATSRYTVWVG